jgi:hypothetical protein
MDLSLETLREALALRRQIESLERRLASILGGGKQTSVRRFRRSGAMSAATRAKLAAAARRRWATRSSAKSGKQRGLSVAGRRKLSAAMKARWASRQVLTSDLYGDPTIDPRPPTKKKRK